APARWPVRCAASPTPASPPTPPPHWWPSWCGTARRRCAERTDPPGRRTPGPVSPRAAGYDVVVVGAGSSGAAYAARAAETPGRRVLLLEAGPVFGAGAAPGVLLDGTRMAA